MQIDLTSISDDESLLFVPKDWIGQGLQFPKIILGHVQREYQKLLNTPAYYQQWIPQPGQMVSDLLTMDLPLQSLAIVTHETKSFFSVDVPNEDLACLKTQTVPRKEFVKSLHRIFGQAWFNGSKCIMDQRFKNSQLPFWVLSFW